MEMEAKEKIRAAKANTNPSNKYGNIYNSEMVVDKSKTSFSGTQSDNSLPDKPRRPI